MRWHRLAQHEILADTAGRAADRRLVLAGERPGPLLAGRLTLVAVAALLATGVSLAVTATVASVAQWGGYITASAILALTYAMIGVILAPLFGRVAGVLIAFVVPFLDLGIAQDPCSTRPRPRGRTSCPATAVPGCSPTPSSPTVSPRDACC